MEQAFATTSMGVAIVEECLETSLRKGMKLMFAYDKAFQTKLSKKIPAAAPATVMKSAELCGNAIKLTCALNGVSAYIKGKQQEEEFKDKDPLEILRAMPGGKQITTAMMVLGPIAQGTIILLELRAFLNDEDVPHEYVSEIGSLQEDMHSCFNEMGRQLSKINKDIKKGFQDAKVHLELVKEEIIANIEKMGEKLEEGSVTRESLKSLERIRVDFLDVFSTTPLLSKYERYIERGGDFNDQNVQTLLSSLRRKTKNMMLADINGLSIGDTRRVDPLLQLSVAIYNPRQTTGVLAFHLGIRGGGGGGMSLIFISMSNIYIFSQNFLPRYLLICEQTLT